MAVRAVRLFLLLAGLATAGAALAQDAQERSRFIRFLEGMLSTPDRQVRLIGLEGAFSSTPTIEQVVVSDREGVWLRIEDLAVTWNRTALFRRTLDIDSVAAARVQVARRPVAGQSGAGNSFSSPVDIEVDGFTLGSITLAPQILGSEATLSAEGSAQIDAEALAAAIRVARVDGPGGTLAADLRLDPSQNALAADIRYSEPADGLLANALNIPDRPALAFELDGAGPLSDWRASLRLSANGVEALAGTAAVARADAAYRVTADLDGLIEPLLPPRYAPLFAGQSDLRFDIVRNDDGTMVVQSADLQSQGTTVAASGRLSADLFPQAAELSLRIGAAGRTGLPFVPGDVSVTSLQLTAGLDAGQSSPWRVEASAENVQSAYGAAGHLDLTATGLADQLAAPAERQTSFRIEARAGGIAPTDPAAAEATGSAMQLASEGRWASGRPAEFQSFDLVLSGATVGFAGQASPEGLDGRYSVSATNLARFSRLLGRDLSGAAALRGTGRVGFAGSFDVQIDGETTDLEVGIAAIDPVLAGRTRIAGGLARSFDTIRFADFTAENEQGRATVTGTLTEPTIDLTVNARIADLSRVTPRASGAVQFSGRIEGSQAEPAVNVEASGSELVLIGRPLNDARFRFAGIVAGPRTAGEASLTGNLGGVPLEGSARLAAGDDGSRLLQDLALSAGPNRAAGDLAIRPDGLAAGRVTVDFPDISIVAPLLLAEARGAVRGEVSLGAEGGQQSARFDATLADLVYETVSVENGQIRGTAENLFSAPRIDGEFSVRSLRAGGLAVVAASGTARRVGPTTAFSVDADLADGDASLVGALEPVDGGFAIAMDTFRFRRPGVDLRLAQPTSVAIRGGAAEFGQAVLLVNSGRATVTGRAGSQLSLTAELQNIPAALANSFAAGLGAEGLVSGRVVASGTAADPTVSFQATWQGGSVEATRNAGLGALSATAEGSYADDRLGVESRISGVGGLALSVDGAVALAAGTLDLRVTGDVPLALGNASLAERGAALRGALRVDVAVTGPIRDPRFAGTITSDGGGFVDPETGIVLSDISLRSTIAGDRLQVERLTARSGDGTVSASGSVSIDPAAAFPVDLTVTVRRARYVDGTLVAAVFDADLTLGGTLASQPVLGGDIRIEEANITVPERLPQGSVALEVLHLYTPAAVQETLTAARLDTERGDGGYGGEPRGIRLDVTIDAPARVFVRGRGLDAELGGRLALSGPVSSIVAEGAFELRRGRFDILTQRITFDRGTVTFQGDLDPILDFSATTTSRNVTITVLVTGRASDPAVEFSSDPELPDDEVLAQLLFNRSIADLSPVQLARLAATAAQYAGGASGGGLLDQLRESTGLDDLDIVTDESGGLALQAGRYISENVYLGIQGGGAEGARVTIDLDITENVKARAALSAQGNSSLGVYYEREY